MAKMKPHGVYLAPPPAPRVEADWPSVADREIWSVKCDQGWPKSVKVGQSLLSQVPPKAPQPPSVDGSVPYKVTNLREN